MRLVLPLAVFAAACGGNLGDPPSSDPDGGERSDEDGATALITYDPSNIPMDHITIGTADIAFTADVTINTDTGEVTGPGISGGLPTDNIFVVVSQSDMNAPALGVFSWASLTVDAGVTINVEGSNGLVFAVNGNVLMNGIIDASAGRLSPQAPGPGGYVGGDDVTPNGAGPGGGTSQGGYDAGGGGGGLGAIGGDGGRQEGRQGGVGGSIAGIESNTPLFGGSGGARGGSAAGAGPGGGGGGAVQISARGEVRLGIGSGINVSGAGGVGGDNDRGGGGGGAGGAVLLEGRYVVVDGVLAANGGGGGAGANEGQQGEDGLPGAFSDVVAFGGNGNGEGTDGGDGAAGGIMAGANGSPGIGNTGGGGGGAGRLFVRSREPASTLGLVSPTAALATGTL